MSALQAARPAELIPPQRQTLWGGLAVANFVLGGLGAGFYAVAAAAAGFGRPPAVALADWLGPALVLAGFAAVAAEAGRPLRGPRVLWRVRTSWMSRELWIGGAFVLLAAADLLFPLRLHRVQAAAAALLLALAQGFIVRRCRGVAAWDSPLMPAVFVASSLISGAGLWLMVEAAGGRAPGRAGLAALAGLVVAALAVWLRYLAGSSDEAAVRALSPLGRGPAAAGIIGLGYAAPLVLVLLAAGRPAAAPALLALAGAGLAGGQCWAKALLILSAGQFRPITLGGIAIQRRSA
jgi:DMSO reductase anchor subunit